MASKLTKIEKGIDIQGVLFDFDGILTHPEALDYPALA